ARSPNTGSASSAMAISQRSRNDARRVGRIPAYRLLASEGKRVKGRRRRTGGCVDGTSALIEPARLQPAVKFPVDRHKAVTLWGDPAYNLTGKEGPGMSASNAATMSRASKICSRTT